MLPPPVMNCGLPGAFIPVALQKLSWPGNVRELEHAIERAVILNREGPLKPEDFMLEEEIQSLSLVVLENGNGSRNGDPSPAAHEGEALNLKVLERQAIRRALAATGGHRIRAAELLGISDRTLRNKLNAAA